MSITIKGTGRRVEREGMTFAVWEVHEDGMFIAACFGPCSAAAAAFIAQDMKAGRKLVPTDVLEFLDEPSEQTQ